MGPQDILDAVESCLKEHKVAGVAIVNTGLSGGFRLILPEGHVARFVEEGIEFCFAGKTPRDIEHDLNQLLNLVVSTRSCADNLANLVRAFKAAAQDHAKSNPIMLMTPSDLTAWQKKHGQPS